jgi:hypothetical protein
MRIEFDGTLAEFKALYGPLFAQAVPVQAVAVAHAPAIPQTQKPPGGVSVGQGDRNEIPAPENTHFAGPLPEISPEWRQETLAYFEEFCRAWAVNFDVVGEQPDRVALMNDLGRSRYATALLIIAYEIGSLQRLVVNALGPMATDEFGTAIAGNMVAVSHMGFPDLAGTFDYSSKWMAA